MALAFGGIASIALINSRMLERLEENENRLKAYTEHLEELVKEEADKLKGAERLAAIGDPRVWWGMIFEIRCKP
jgi:hypothetical protein